jgi:hypothetical protein
MIGSISTPTPINHSRMYCFACIPPIPPCIPFGLFASYAVYLPLSTPALWLSVCQVSVELFSIYCLFWTTWLNTHSGVSYGLNSYLDGLQLEGTYLTILWYYYSCTIYRSRSPAGCRWVTAFQLTTLTLHLFVTDLRTIPRCNTTHSNLVCMSIQALVSPMSWHGVTRRLGEYVKSLPCRAKYWLYGSLVGYKWGAQDCYRCIGGGLDSRWGVWCKVSKSPLLMGNPCPGESGPYPPSISFIYICSTLLLGLGIEESERFGPTDLTG